MNEVLKHNNDEHERCQRESKLTKMQKAQRAGYERRTNKK